MTDLVSVTSVISVTSVALKNVDISVDRIKAL